MLSKTVSNELLRPIRFYRYCLELGAHSVISLFQKMNVTAPRILRLALATDLVLVASGTQALSTECSRVGRPGGARG